MKNDRICIYIFYYSIYIYILQGNLGKFCPYFKIFFLYMEEKLKKTLDNGVVLCNNNEYR